MAGFKAPVGKLPPLSVFQAKDTVWTVSDDQQVAGVVEAVSLNFPDPLPQTDVFPADEQVEVLRLARPRQK